VGKPKTNQFNSKQRNMERIFITGSADGLGYLAAEDLIAKGHQVVLHARNEDRAKQVIEKLPGAETVLTADLADLEDTAQLAEKVNSLGAFDVIIHNAGVYYAPGEELFKVNTLAPYLLTCLINKPERLVYLSSDMHLGGHAKFEHFESDPSRFTYSDTKLHVVMLCKAIARKWKDVYANALNPGWVPTRMGGPGAPDSFESGYKTQVWLATSNDEKVKTSGRFFYHQKEIPSSPEADDIVSQDKFLNLCSKITGVSI
jgi:NAD(P)-dependent dehydrogenase (short-subunit alcohol dehydrogenase family)